MSSARPWTLVADYGDHISETRHDTHSEVMAHLRNGFTYGLLERAGYAQGQLDGLEADAFRALLADSGLTTHVIEGGD